MQLLSSAGPIQILEEQRDFMLLMALLTSLFQKAQIPDSQNVPVPKPNFVRQVESVLVGKDNNYPQKTYCAGFHSKTSMDAANLLRTTDHSNDYRT